VVDGNGAWKKDEDSRGLQSPLHHCHHHYYYLHILLLQYLGDSFYWTEQETMGQGLVLNLVVGGLLLCRKPKKRAE
jgi:hypothetical protein